MVSQVIKGTAETFDLYLKDANGNPIAITGDVNYEVRDFNSDLIVSGIATQDVNDSGHWSTIIVVPTTASVTSSGNKYSILWTVITAAGVNKEITEQFDVIGDFEEQQLDVLAQDEAILESGSYVEDVLVLNSIPESYQLTLETDLGADVHIGDSVTSPTPTAQVNGKYYFKYTSPAVVESMIAGNTGVTYYQAVWTYVINGQSYTETHPVYVMNNKMWMFMHDLKCEIAQDILGNVNPNLMMPNSKLLYAVNKGIKRINSTPPTNSIYTISTLPQSLYFATQQAITVSALKKMFLVEGLSNSFDLQAQSISLTVDRKEAIKECIDDIEEWLGENLKTLKKEAARKSGVGALTISRTSVTTYRGPTYGYGRKYSYLLG